MKIRRRNEICMKDN